MRTTLTAVLVWMLFVTTATAQQQETPVEPQVVVLSADGLEVTAGGDWPNYDESWALHNRMQAMTPYVTLDGEGDAYFRHAQLRMWETDFDARYEDWRIVIAAPKTEGLTGKLYVPEADGSGMRALTFDVTDSEPEEADADTLTAARRDHYQHLVDRGVAGAAWFRHQAQQGRTPTEAAQDDMPDALRTHELTQTYALFTGGRAVAENLQLDRLLRVVDREDQPTVPIDQIEGITIDEIDWQPLIEGKQPEEDPLAALIPADQHALLFPSFSAMLTLMDEAEANGTPILRTLEVRSEDAVTRERYQQQLCLQVSTLSRLIGPKLVSSVAYTGSDPYLRTGSDLAVLFEARDADLLAGHVRRQQDAAASEHGTEIVEREIRGVPCRVVVTPDRRISSYLAVLDSVVVVSNSPAQLERIIAVHQQEATALASLDEYTFFRDRYRRGDEAETALLIVTDATIRRWCGPKWRIATSRRTIAQAVMMQIESEHLDRLLAGEVPDRPLKTRYDLEALGEVTLDADGVHSDVYNTVEFLTPIRELNLDTVTKAERDAYEQWRQEYQNRWRQNFDPIAVRLSVTEEKLAADVTVMPLIAGSDYREFIQLTRGEQIDAEAGDRHPEALVHYAMAIDRQSLPMRQASGMAMGMGIEVDPLAWLGNSVALYADQDPFWAEAGKAEDMEAFMEDNFHRLPVAFHAEVTNGLKLAGFLTSLRATVQSTAPDMTTWETLRHNDKPYVRIRPTENATGGAPGDAWDELAIYYAARADGLTVTLNEAVLKRALDRQAGDEKPEEGDKPADDAEADESFKPMPWLGNHAALQMGPEAVAVLDTLSREPFREAMQARSWANLPILNAWKHHYPDHDPQQIYRKYWGARLVCPGGGEYVWNQAFQTYESTAYGHPAEPKAGPGMPEALRNITAGNFGLTFEQDGLRARAELQRQPTEQ